MKTNSNKNRIMEHLTITGNVNFKRYSGNFKSESSIIRETQPKTPESRKKGIREHLARSSANFNCFSLRSPEGKQRVIEHIRLSKG